MKTTLDYALEYIARGWSVIPLAPRSKAPYPRFTLSPYLKGEKRLSEAEITDLLTERPDLGIGIITGKPSGIIVADVDPRNGGEWFDPRVRAERLITDRAATGGGGTHWFYAYEPSRCGQTRLPGVDRKSDGGYICAPPSLHPSGSRYEWLEWWPHLELPKAPWDIMSGPSQSDSPGAVGPWVAETLANPRGVTVGTQEETLTRLCWWAAGHLDEDVAMAVLTQWAAGLPLGNPHDPWTDEHIESRLSRAYDKRDPSPGKAGGVVTGTPTPAGRPAPRAVSVRDYCKAVDEAGPQAWLVEDLLAPGCITEIVAKVKEGKSTFIGSMLRAMQAGGTFLNRPTKDVPILLISEQMGLSFKATMARAQLLEAAGIYVMTAADLFGLSWVEKTDAILSQAQEHDCGLLVLDTFAQLAGIEDEDKASTSRYLDPFIGAKGKGLSILMARHSRKSGGSLSDAGRGSSAISGQADIILYLTAPLGLAKGYRSLEGGGRLGEVFTEHLEYEEGGYVIGEDPKELKAQAKFAPVVGALSDAGPAGLTVKGIVEETGLKGSTVYSHLTKLADQGRVEKQGEVYTLLPPPQAGGIA